MKILLFICAQSNAVDYRTNDVSLFNILDDVYAPAFPIAIPNISVLLCLKREKDEADPDFSLRISLNGEILAEGPVGVKFGEHVRTRAFTDIQGLVVSAPGVLMFQIIEDGRKKAEWEVNIMTFGPEIVPQPIIRNDGMKKGKNTTKRQRKNKI